MSILACFFTLALPRHAWAEEPQEHIFTLSNATLLPDISREQIEQSGPLTVAEIVSNEGAKGKIICSGDHPSCSLVVQGQSKLVPAEFNAEGEVEWLTTSVVLVLSGPKKNGSDLQTQSCPDKDDPLYQETRCFPFTISPNRTRKGQHLIALMVSWGGIPRYDETQRGGPAPFPWLTLRYAYAIEEWVRYTLRVDTIGIISVAQTGADFRLLSHPLASLSFQADVMIGYFLDRPSSGFASGVSASFGGPSIPLTFGVDTLYLAAPLTPDLLALRLHATLEGLVSENGAMILRLDFIIPLDDERDKHPPLIVHAGLGAQW